jgi:hypothetical protein
MLLCKINMTISWKIYSLTFCLNLQCSRSCGGGKQNRTYMCLSDPVHRRPVHESYCSNLRREELVRYCNQDVSCAEWAYGDSSPVSIDFYFYYMLSIISLYLSLMFIYLSLMFGLRNKILYEN